LQLAIVVDRKHQDAIIAEQREEVVLVLLWTASTNVNTVILARPRRSRHVNVEAVALHERHTLLGNRGEVFFSFLSSTKDGVEPLGTSRLAVFNKFWLDLDSVAKASFTEKARGET